MAVEANKHVHSTKTYYLVFFALIVFTATTTAIAFFDLGALNGPVALAIATIKALLVILFFMHVKDSSRLTWITVTGAIFWLLILLLLTMTDFVTRAWH